MIWKNRNSAVVPDFDDELPEGSDEEEILSIGDNKMSYLGRGARELSRIYWQGLRLRKHWLDVDAEDTGTRRHTEPELSYKYIVRRPRSTIPRHIVKRSLDQDDIVKMRGH